MRIAHPASLVASSALLLLVASFSGSTQHSPWDGSTSLVLGQALPGLTEEQSAAFKDGLQAFSTTETREDGLGPVFNGTSCGECHKAGAIGGASTDLTISRVTRIGGYRNNQYSDLADLGGPVLQARSLKEFDTACPISGEVVPSGNVYVSHRITTPLFGAGLIEAIPDSAILANAGKADADGVKGMANFEINPLNGQKEVGRFGWKAQHSNLEVFAADAYLNEMGITTTLFPTENKPQGNAIPAGWDSVADPEDHDGDAVRFATFMRLLAPPGRRLPLTTQVLHGENVFNAIRCTACHKPSLTTGPNPVSALSNREVPLYSDLLLHRMGSLLADRIKQGQADGAQFRTAPLWGLSRRNFYLHDGRATTYMDAIRYHDGEAAAAKARFNSLSISDQAALFAFLNSL